MKKIVLAVLFSACCLPLLAAEDAELAFYQRLALTKATSSKQDRAFASALANDVKTWLRVHPQNPEAKTALLMKADYHIRAREDSDALVSLYQVRFYFPASQDVSLLSANVESVIENLNRNEKAQALKLLALNSEGLNDTQKRVFLLEALVKANLSDIYEPVCELFEEFFADYPSYPQKDRLTLQYGDWHRQNGNFYAAVAEYKKVNELFPDTPYKAAGLRMVADVYGGDLKDYDTAVSVYNQVLEQYPDSSERGLVYKHLAVLEENRKDYPAALAYYDKAIADLGSQSSAYEAWLGKADVLAKTKEYRSAYDTLMKAAEIFSSDENKYVDALFQAAYMANRRLKNPALQSACLEKALLAYPQTQRASELMYDLGYAYEKQDKRTQAADTYKRLIVRFPTDKYASRAQSRLSRLEK